MSRQRFNKLLWYGALTLSSLYMLNLTAGFDLLPDNLPLLGNLDEAGATVLLLQSLKEIKK